MVMHHSKQFCISDFLSLHVRTLKSHASLPVVIERYEIMQEKHTTSINYFVLDKRWLPL